MRLAIRAFGLTAYAAFLGAFVYFIGFTAGLLPGKPPAPPVQALAIDLALVAFFGVAHSAMARPRFKQAWTRVVPTAAERSVYVLVASAQLTLLCWQWRPLAGPPLWQATGWAALALQALQSLGWATVLLSSFLLDHFEMFGLRQTFGRMGAGLPSLRMPLLYRLVRHPIYLGLLVALWSAAALDSGRLLLGALLTAYLLIGVRHEERDLLRTFGDEYRRYQERVPGLLPWPRPAVARVTGRAPSQ